MQPIALSSKNYNHSDKYIQVKNTCTVSIHIANTGDSDCQLIDGYLLSAGENLCLPYIEGCFYSEDINIRWIDTTQTCKLQVILHQLTT